MKSLRKKILALFLGMSNLVVFGLVFQTYIDGGYTKINLFSRNDRADKIEKKVRKSCGGTLFEQLKNEERTSFLCAITVSRRHNGASYKLRLNYLVQKGSEQNGQDYTFTLQERKMLNRDRTIAVEADFCNDCEDGNENTGHGSDMSGLMEAIIAHAGEIYTEAENAVEEAQEEHNRQSRLKQQSLDRENRCEGIWDEDNKDFEEFHPDERLECKMKKISRLGSPLEVENYYHNELGRDLWQLAVSDDDSDVRDFFEDHDFSNPYRYTLSVRSSTGLLKNYVTDWKDRFAEMDDTERRYFANRLDSELERVKAMTQRRSNEVDVDRYYLNQGLDGALAGLRRSQEKLNRPVVTPSPSPPASGEWDWDAIREGTRGL